MDRICRALTGRSTGCRPTRDWRIESLEAVAAATGVNVHKSGGSHVVFEYPAAEAISVLARRPINPVYVRGFVAFVEAVRASHE